MYASGRLTGSLVSELENCWKDIPSFDASHPIRLDLGGVTFVDKNAKALLSEMVANGVQPQADGPMMTSVAALEIYDKFVASTNCGLCGRCRRRLQIATSVSARPTFLIPSLRPLWIQVFLTPARLDLFTSCPGVRVLYVCPDP